MEGGQRVQAEGSKVVHTKHEGASPVETEHELSRARELLETNLRLTDAHFDTYGNSTKSLANGDGAGVGDEMKQNRNGMEPLPVGFLIDTELDISATRCSELRASIISLAVSLDQLAEMHADVCDQNVALSQSNEAIAQRNSAMAAELAELRSRSQRIDQDDSRLLDLQNELAVLQSTVERLRESGSSQSNAETQVAKLQTEVHRLDSHLREQADVHASQIAKLLDSQAKLKQWLAEGDMPLGLVPSDHGPGTALPPSATGQLLHRYESLVRENAQLLSALFKARNNIMVLCRVRPPTLEELRYTRGGLYGGSMPHGADDGNEEGDATHAVAPADQHLAKGKKRDPQLGLLGPSLVVDVLSDTEIAFYDKQRRAWRPYAYDRVFGPEASQKDVFREVAPLAQAVMEGYNSCVLAYGITGSGKTHTMSGPDSDPGINLRIVDKIFELVALRQTTHRYHVRVSMLEIYNEELRDLLLPPGQSPTRLEIRTVGTASGEVYVQPSTSLTPNAPASVRTSNPATAGPGSVQIPTWIRVEVTSPPEIMQVLAKGSAIRATAATNIHEHSSRSHCVVRIEVEGVPLKSSNFASDDNDVFYMTIGRLYLVDLAGSERVRKSAVTGVRLREAQYINKSLSALGDVLEALDKKASHIPYRNSKLTHLLQDSLGGSARTLMMATICPGAYTADETSYSLQFAARARSIDLGPAQRTVQYKNISDQFRALRQEYQAVENARGVLEKEFQEIKRDKAVLEERLSQLKENASKASDLQRRALAQRVDQLRKEMTTLQEALLEERKQRTTEQEAAVALAERLRKEQHLSAISERDRRLFEQRLAQYQKEIMHLKTALTEARVAAGSARRLAGIAPPAPAEVAVKQALHNESGPIKGHPQFGNEVIRKFMPLGPHVDAADGEADASGKVGYSVALSQNRADAGSRNGRSPEQPTAEIGSASVRGQVSTEKPAPYMTAKNRASQILMQQRERRAKREEALAEAKRAADEAEKKVRDALRKNANRRVGPAPKSFPTGSNPLAQRGSKAGGPEPGERRPGRAVFSAGQASHTAGGVDAARAGALTHEPMVHGIDTATTRVQEYESGTSEDDTVGGTFIVGIINPPDSPTAAESSYKLLANGSYLPAPYSLLSENINDAEQSPTDDNDPWFGTDIPPLRSPTLSVAAGLASTTDSHVPDTGQVTPTSADSTVVAPANPASLSDAVFVSDSPARSTAASIQRAEDFLITPTQISEQCAVPDDLSGIASVGLGKPIDSTDTLPSKSPAGSEEFDDTFDLEGILPY